jgi:glucose-1-phosphate cytidylyltransferase
MFGSQLRQELTVMARNGEQLLLLIGIPVLLLVFFSQTNVLPTDGLANIDIGASILAHKIAGKICTISAVHPAGRFGSLRLEEDGSIHAFCEKPQFEEAFVNGGYMVCENRIFNYIHNDSTMMLERQPMNDLVRDGELHSYRHDGFWQPMDTYQEAMHLNKLWSEGKAPWKVW